MTLLVLNNWALAFNIDNKLQCKLSLNQEISTVSISRMMLTIEILTTFAFYDLTVSRSSYYRHKYIPTFSNNILIAAISLI